MLWIKLEHGLRPSNHWSFISLPVLIMQIYYTRFAFNWAVCVTQLQSLSQILEFA